MVKMMLGSSLAAEQLTTIWKKRELERLHASCVAEPPAGLEQGSPAWAYIAVRVLAGSNVILDAANGGGWASEQGGAGVNNGLAGRTASDGLSVQGDTEGKMQIRVPLAPRGYISPRRNQVTPEGPSFPSIGQHIKFQLLSFTYSFTPQILTECLLGTRHGRCKAEEDSHPFPAAGSSRFARKVSFD